MSTFVADFILNLKQFYKWQAWQYLWAGPWNIAFSDLLFDHIQVDINTLHKNFSYV